MPHARLGRPTDVPGLGLRLLSLAALVVALLLALASWHGYDGDLFGIGCTWHPTSVGILQAAVGAVVVLALVVDFVLLQRWADSRIQQGQLLVALAATALPFAAWLPLHLVALGHHGGTFCPM